MPNRDLVLAAPLSNGLEKDNGRRFRRPSDTACAASRCPDAGD